MRRIIVCVLFCLHWFCFDQPWSLLVRLILILDPDLWSLFLDPDPGRGPVDGDNQVNHERQQFLRLLGMHWTALTGLMLFSASPCLVENSGEVGSDCKYQVWPMSSILQLLQEIFYQIKVEGLLDWPPHWRWPSGDHLFNWLSKYWYDLICL